VGVSGGTATGGVHAPRSPESPTGGAMGGSSTELSGESSPGCSGAGLLGESPLGGAVGGSMAG
jgi:hypothetical protein